MTGKICAWCLVPLLFLCAPSCRSSTGDVVTGVAPDTVFRGAKTIMKTRPGVRFAVLDFSDGAGNFTAYGKVIGDETFYRLSALKGIRMVERRRLNAIIEENGLEQAGLVSNTGRERLGRLLAADILVTGSYVHEDGRVRVNGRYIEVTTGEIRGTFMYYLGGARETARGAEKPEDEPESCEPYEKMIEPYLRDLRTPDMVEKAVEAAVKIPYTMKCRHVHRHIMGTLARGRHYPERYVRFLGDSVIAIKDPEEVERKSSVFYYYQSDKKIDEREWNIGILSMKNANERTIRRIVGFIMNRGRPQDEALLFRRIDTLMALTGAGAFGKPHLLTTDQMFLAILVVGPPSETTRAIRLYLLEKYAPSVTKVKKNLSYILSFTEKSLTPEKDRPSRVKFYDHIMKIFSSVEPGDDNDVSFQLMGFIGEMHYRHEKEDAAELRTLTTALGPWFCYAVTQVRRDYRLQGVIRILKKYNIQCGK